jgi:hypothetical protein
MMNLKSTEQIAVGKDKIAVELVIEDLRKRRRSLDDAKKEIKRTLGKDVPGLDEAKNAEEIKQLFLSKKD